MKAEFITKIKSRGYWRINFRPIEAPMQLTLKQCEELVERNNVRLRGWYYPFYGHGNADNHGIENLNNCCQGWIESGEFKEFWRMYKSGQFLHYKAVNEDWYDEPGAFYKPQVPLEAGKRYLNFVGSLTYHVTEIMEFLSRLHKDGLYGKGAYVSISLNNTKDRELTSFDFLRHLLFPRITAENNITFEKTYSQDELNQTGRELAIEPLKHVYEVFNFGDISVEQVIKKDQEALYKSIF
jgi:hypothetical protein